MVAYLKPALVGVGMFVRTHCTCSRWGKRSGVWWGVDGWGHVTISSVSTLSFTSPTSSSFSTSSSVPFSPFLWAGWSGGVKVLCILHHRGIQLTLVRVEGEFFVSSVSSLSFLFLFLPCPSPSSPLLSLLSLYSLSLGDDTKWLTRVGMSLNKNSNKKAVPIGSLVRDILLFLVWRCILNSGPAEPGYALPLQTVKSRSVGFFRSQLIWIYSVFN